MPVFYKKMFSPSVFFSSLLDFKPFLENSSFFLKTLLRFYVYKIKPKNFGILLNSKLKTTYIRFTPKLNWITLALSVLPLLLAQVLARTLKKKSLFFFFLIKFTIFIFIFNKFSPDQVKTHCPVFFTADPQGG